jgi:phosphoribosylformylglycinamidine synthase subunit PurS
MSAAMDFLARVFVTPKSAILDPQGKAIASSLQSLGYDEVVDARMGKLVVLRLSAADQARAETRVGEMCKRLLANEVIEEFSFEIEPEGVAAQ